MVVNVTKISQRVKNKSLLSAVKLIQNEKKVMTQQIIYRNRQEIINLLQKVNFNEKSEKKKNKKIMKNFEAIYKNGKNNHKVW